MNNIIYTSIEQSKHLLDLGLKPETADMYYFLDPTPAGNIYHLAVQMVDIGVKKLPEYDKGDIPCWSIGALLNLMPPYLFEWERGIDLQIYPHLSKKHGWLVSYIPNNVEYMQKDKFRQICHADTLIEAAYNMVVWLLENNYIKKGE